MTREELLKLPPEERQALFGRAMAYHARNFDAQPSDSLLPGDPWKPKRGGARERVPIEKIRAAANAGLSHYDAADRLGLSVEHLRRQAKKHGIEFRTIRKWVRAE